MNIMIVFLGAGLGGVARHMVNMLMSRVVAHSGFPYGTLSVNILGSLLMGLCVSYFLLRSGTSLGWRLFLTTGIMGGFTTFSAFSLETVLMLQRGDLMIAALYISASVVFGIAALFAGLYLARILFA